MYFLQTLIKSSQACLFFNYFCTKYTYSVLRFDHDRVRYIGIIFLLYLRYVFHFSPLSPLFFQVIHIVVFLFTFSIQYRHPSAVVPLEVPEGPVQDKGGGWVHGITSLGPIDTDQGDRANAVHDNRTTC